MLETEKYGSIRFRAQDLSARQKKKKKKITEQRKDDINQNSKVNPEKQKRNEEMRNLKFQSFE